MKMIVFAVITTVVGIAGANSANAQSAVSTYPQTDAQGDRSVQQTTASLMITAPLVTDKTHLIQSVTARNVS